VGGIALPRDEAGKFLPGESGNPGGRRAGQNVKSIIEKKLQDFDADGFTRAEKIAEVILRFAESGEQWACTELLRRIWPAPAAVKLETDTANRIDVVVYGSGRNKKIPGAKPISIGVP